uniref:Uncharacterized protein n=1 Tax=Burkholderia cenocepacia TaxID=95486 RepID=A0A071M611_9BURK
MCNEVLRQQLCLWLQYNGSCYFLAEIVVRQRHDRNLKDVRMRGQAALYVRRRDILAASNDDVL